MPRSRGGGRNGTSALGDGEENLLGEKRHSRSVESVIAHEEERARRSPRASTHCRSRAITWRPMTQLRRRWARDGERTAPETARVSPRRRPGRAPPMCSVTPRGDDGDDAAHWRETIRTSRPVGRARRYARSTPSVRHRLHARRASSPSTPPLALSGHSTIVGESAATRPLKKMGLAGTRCARVSAAHADGKSPRNHRLHHGNQFDILIMQRALFSEMRAPRASRSKRRTAGRRRRAPMLPWQIEVKSAKDIEGMRAAVASRVLDAARDGGAGRQDGRDRRRGAQADDRAERVPVAAQLPTDPSVASIDEVICSGSPTRASSAPARSVPSPWTARRGTSRRLGDLHGTARWTRQGRGVATR